MLIHAYQDHKKQTIKNVHHKTNIMTKINTKKLEQTNKLISLIKKILKIRKHKQTYKYIKPLKIITYQTQIDTEKILENYEKLLTKQVEKIRNIYRQS